MPVLTSAQRKLLDDACVKGRRAADQAVRAALSSLAVVAERPPAHLSEDDRRLRRGLRAKARQLGDTDDKLDLLIGECAYEQWHRLLFARFLAENNLLIHPEYRAPVTLGDCEELADALGEPDGWSVAGRFAAEILPGIFRPDDPCVQLRLTPEGRLALEGIVASLPEETFRADDALGWVYQYWQKEQKDEVNRSDRKVGGADLGPVTQLFTENYMVRFLLENSLGAWWAARHPDSPLIKEWEYLRFDEGGRPAAGSFDGWPNVVAEVTVMDPCCGSGHFLVEAFGMLWRMRVEAERLDPVAAQDAVLRDNLFGLELDPRCVQIAMFAVAIQAWKAGGGWRELPVPNIACSGIPVRAQADEWKALAGGDELLEKALVRLHILFRDADILGSLIDPKRAVEIADPTSLQRSFDDISWIEVAPLIRLAAASESDDPATAVLGADAAVIARSAQLLSRRYSLVATNVPYLTAQKQEPRLADHISSSFALPLSDLFTAMMIRAATHATTVALVSPQKWWFLATFENFRSFLFRSYPIVLAANLGVKSFTTPMWDFPIGLTVASERDPGSVDGAVAFVDASAGRDAASKSALLRSVSPVIRPLRSVTQSPGAILASADTGAGVPLSSLCDMFEGQKPGQTQRATRQFWEIESVRRPWKLLASSPGSGSDAAFSGLSKVVLEDKELLARVAEANTSGQGAHGRRGVLIAKIGELPASLYGGWAFDNNTFALVPHDESVTGALWQFVASGEFTRAARAINQKLDIALGAVGQVPFDLDRWRRVAEEAGPLPEPWSDDPTQWLFEGRPDAATEPLQAGVGRLLGYRWPGQAAADDLDVLVDDDGVVCVPSVRGERIAAERLQELLARAFGGTWSPARTHELLTASGSTKKDLGEWLRDDFFKAHCQLFKNRPFVWQVWDGRKDGFSALVNYHKLDRPALEKLTYSYLGDWIERQVAGVRDDVAGAEARLAAARALQHKLEQILAGEPPYDIYVRWKPLSEQPLGWEPDLNDGVRVNVRPFVEAGVLRAKFNVKWDKDRGKNPDGTDRLNDLHYTLAQKQAARGGRA